MPVDSATKCRPAANAYASSHRACASNRHASENDLVGGRHVHDYENARPRANAHGRHDDDFQFSILRLKTNGL